MSTETYPGELDMLRGLARTLRVVVRPDTVDVAEVRRLLWQHVADDAAARAEAQGKSSRDAADATPDFFQPGREYQATLHAELRFRCLATGAHPDEGHLLAFGWRHNARTAQWRPSSLDRSDWACCGWVGIDTRCPTCHRTFEDCTCTGSAPRHTITSRKDGRR